MFCGIMGIIVGRRDIIRGRNVLFNTVCLYHSYEKDVAHVFLYRIVVQSIRHYILNQHNMIPDKILYTDGHDVVVTDSTFQVRKTEYRLNGITKHGLTVLRPDRLPGILIFALGAILAICGLLQLISPAMMNDVLINGSYVSANTLALWIGAGLALLGIIIMAVVRERYAVRIATAEGEKNAIVSHKKEYIAQIVDALNKAITYIRVNTATANTTTYITVKD